MKNFFNQNEINSIKRDFHIVDYLEKKGYEPVKKHFGEWLYQSPGSNERTPSFYVNVLKNVYTDYSGNSSNTGEKGDVIRLVQSLEGIDFIYACNKIMLTDFEPLGLRKFDVSEPQKKGIGILNVRPLKSRALIDYIESRRIDYHLADRYVNEVSYINSGQKYFSIGFPNDRGGFALRAAKFKGQTEPQYFTTLRGMETDTINVFEGFFSCLSCLQYFQHDCYKNTTYVLNGVGNLNKLIPYISDNVRIINVFFDNDIGGRTALTKLMQFDNWDIIDQSKLYADHNDFNEFLMSR